MDTKTIIHAYLYDKDGRLVEDDYFYDYDAFKEHTQFWNTLDGHRISVKYIFVKKSTKKGE